MFKLTEVSKSFANQQQGEFKVFSGITLDVREGELLCIIGPSGCGKTTLLQIMAGFISPTTGSITLDGKERMKPGPDIVLMFQHYALFPWLTVRDNVMFGLSATRISASQKQALTSEYLALVGLKEFADWFPYQLSGGMQQRVALARALIGRPRILLMDEPFSSVDAQYRDYLRQSLVELWQKTKTTIVFVTHSITEAVYLGSRVVILSKTPATVKEIVPITLQHPRNRYDALFVTLASQLEEKIEKPGDSFAKLNINQPYYVQTPV